MRSVRSTIYETNRLILGIFRDSCAAFFRATVLPQPQVAVWGLHASVPGYDEQVIWIARGVRVLCSRPRGFEERYLAAKTGSQGLLEARKLHPLKMWIVSSHLRTGPIGLR